jgi:hypothetical protein
MLVSGIELGYWFLQWKKVIESVRNFRDSGVSGIETGCLFEKLPSFSGVFN